MSPDRKRHFSASYRLQRRWREPSFPSGRMLLSPFIMCRRDLRLFCRGKRRLPGTCRHSIWRPRAVEKIRAGRGMIDLATDCVELAALFRANADGLRGKTAVTADQISEAADLGTQLLSLLRPKGARQAAPSRESKEAVEVRNR